MTNPDWENFTKAVLADWPTGDLEGSVLFDLSLQYGMIQEVPGGFNSDHHVDAEGICPEEGDPWYEYTFRGEAGPGLYSINDMTKRIEAQAAEIERLMKERDAAVHLARMRKAYIEEARDERDAFEAKLEKAVDGLKECEAEIDAYIQYECPHDHPIQERCRQRDYAANPARVTLSKLTGAKP